MTSRRTAIVALLVALLVAWVWWATSLPPFSARATLAVVGAGAVALLWGVTHRHPRSGVIERRGVTVWFVLAAVLGGWQLAAFVQEPRSTHPTLSSIADFVLETHVAQALACAAWLIVMVKLAAR